jgi:aminoglycoside phosphotransferase (APT) family kinase protein
MEVEVHTTAGSSTPQTTSTQYYGHEPFNTFRYRVLALSTNLWPCDIDDVRRLKGGSFNRIVAARISCSKHDLVSSEDQDIVLRIPRHVYGSEPHPRIQDQAAVFQFVHQQGIQAPAVLAFDATSTNALSSPYAVQSYIDGTALDLVYDHLSLGEKLDITSQFVELLAKFETVEFPLPGRLASGPGTGRLRCWNSFDTQRSEVDWTIEVHPFSSDSPPITSATASTPLSLVRHELDSWPDRLREQVRQGSLVGHKIDYVRRLQRICDDMQANNHFIRCQQRSKNVLHHCDLDPRNLLVRREDEGSKTKWTIVGVLDWDDALSLPTILCRKPPVWLWDPSYNRSSWVDHHRFDGDVDFLPTNHYDDLEGDAAQIKRHFEEAYTRAVMSTTEYSSREDYLDDAYGTGRWLRRLARFAHHGFTYPEDARRLEHLEHEWELAMLSPLIASST